MTTATAPRLLTSEQLLHIPDDGRERWLIDGELREGEMTRRNRGHSRIEAKLCGELHNWLKRQPEPRGEVLAGEAGILLRRNPDTTVGVDVAYISAQTADANPDDEGFVVGIPELVVEILSPSDKHEDVTEKVQTYLAVGVKLVWVADPAFRTVTVFRGDAEPRLFNMSQTLDAEPCLPGFTVAVRDVFNR